MIKKDTLWKGIIEDLAEDLLQFFFPKAIDLIDWDKPFVFLDKELQQLFPESAETNRYADKLFKVWLRSGEEQWFLVHIEVQGYPDADFARRMYEYYYRIQARFGRLVTALVIYTHTNRSYHFKEYRFSFLGTELLYRFNAFILLDHPMETLRMSNNIFAAVLEAAWQGLIRQKPKDEELFKMKTQLVRRLLERNYTLTKVRHLLKFIRFYVDFEQTQFSRNFEKELENITKTRSPMGIEEAIREELKKQAWEEGLEEGLEEGREEGREEGLVLAAERLLKKGFSVQSVAELLPLPIEKIKQIEQRLKEAGETDNDHNGH